MTVDLAKVGELITNLNSGKHTSLAEIRLLKETANEVQGLRLAVCSTDDERTTLRAENVKQAEEIERLQGRHRASQEALSELLTEHRKQGEEREKLVVAASELLECADLRGDADLPHPSDDPKLWTARMQDAWEGLRAALPPNPTETATEGGDESG